MTCGRPEDVRTVGGMAEVVQSPDTRQGLLYENGESG